MNSFAAGSLAGRVALVTGAGSGIGRAVSQVLAGLGASVAALDVDPVGAEATVAGLVGTGATAVPLVVDLGRPDDVAGVVDDVRTRLGPPTILVNNAGMVLGQRLLDTDLAAWNLTLNVNLTAAFILTRAAGLGMIEHGAGGNIVNISSSSAFRAMQTSGVYAVSKAGLGSLTRAAAWELGPHGINVNAVAPGVTRTGITVRGIGGDQALDQAVSAGPLENLLHRVSEPEDIANVVAFLCLPSSRQITGQVVQVSAGAVVAAG
jgi:NAD(P)-dependent dehydrogenase (short-subunit alcohol dehydrogenase family)